MPSFFFWLTVAMGFGALLGTLLPPIGVAEIVIAMVVLNGLFYGARKFERNHRQRIA